MTTFSPSSVLKSGLFLLKLVILIAMPAFAEQKHTTHWIAVSDGKIVGGSFSFGHAVPSEKDPESEVLELHDADFDAGKGQSNQKGDDKTGVQEASATTRNPVEGMKFNMFGHWVVMFVEKEIGRDDLLRFELMLDY